MTDKARFLKKNIGGPNLGPMDLNQAQNDVIRLSLDHIFSLKLYAMIVNDRGKTHEKKFSGPNLGRTDLNRAQKFSFFAIFSSLVTMYII